MRTRTVAAIFLCFLSLVARAQIAVGSNQLDFNFGQTKIHAFTYKAPSYSEGCLIIAFHGDNRRPEWTRDAAIPLANEVGALVIAPDFDVERFGNRLYQGGNVMGQSGMNEPLYWTYSYIPKMIEYVRYWESSPKLPVYLIGHSAGGQFVGRMAAVMDTDVVRYVAANPSAWAFSTIESRWGYGLGGLDAQYTNEAWLKHYLAQPLTVYLGQQDTGNNDLDDSAGAQGEGATRIERGRRFFNYGKDLAASRGWTFNWRLVEVPGIGHDQFGMFRASRCCMRYLARRANRKSMKIGALLFAVSTLCVAQCTKTSLTHQTPNVVGDWVSAVIKMSRKGKHTLHLDANGSFNERFADPGQPDHTASGIYTITIEDLPSERDNSTEKTGIVNLFYKTLDGKAASQQVQNYPRRFVCGAEAGAPILTDILEEILTRPQFRQKLMAALKASAPKPEKPYHLSAGKKPSQTKWKEMWRVPSTARPFHDSGLMRLSNDRLAFDSGDGRIVIDSNGHGLGKSNVRSCSQIFALRLPSGDAIGEYNTWDQSVRVRDLNGKLLWEHADSSGVDCACAVSLGNHVDGVAISYNGGGGALLLDANGKVIWQVSNLGNAWSVAQLRWQRGAPAGLIIGESSARIVDSQGSTIKTLDEDAGAVVGADIDGDGCDEALTLGTTVASGLRLSAYDLAGKQHWTVRTKDSAAFLEKPILFGRFLSKTPCIAVADVGGLVQFFSVAGKPIGVFTLPDGDCEGICSIPNHRRGDDLIVRTSKGVVRCAYLG